MDPTSGKRNQISSKTDEELMGSDTKVGQYKILVVEDDPDMQHMLRDLLTKSGYTPLPAQKAKEALEYIGKWHVDLMILDIHMPGASGVDLLRVLRRRNIQIPTVVVSGFISEELAAQLSRLDVQSMLAKPFNADRILGEIHKYLN